MSYSTDNLSASERQAIASACFQVTEQRGDEIHGLCPFHHEKQPSFSYNVAKDLCNCFSCGATGDLIALWGQANSYSDNTEAFKAFKNQYAPSSSPAGHIGGRGVTGGQGEATKPAEETRYVPESEYQALEPLSGPLLQTAHSFCWSDATIAALGIRQRGNAIAIPIRQDDGQLANIRLYTPGATDNKIISWGKGYGKNKLFPSPSNWKKTGPIVICEGEKDTITALSKGFNAVTQTAGANSWADQFNRFFSDRTVIIAYDADEKGQTGAQKVAAKLADTAKSIQIITWPENIMAVTPDHGQDITDYFGRHNKTAQDLKDLIAATPVQSINNKTKTTSDDVQRFFGGERGKTFRPRFVADEVMQWRDLIHDPKSGVMYSWAETHWAEYDLANIRRQILHMLQDEGTTPRVNDAITIVCDLATVEAGRKMNDQKNIIPIKNGVFSLETFNVADHRPSNLNTYIIDVEIDTTTPPPPPALWMEKLTEIMPDALSTRELQKFFGYCLTRETRHEKALLFIGPGGDGKGTILKILQALVGNQNTSNVTLGGLQDQFHRVMLVDKLLNVATEVEAGLLQSDIFKTIVSGEGVSAAYKHKNAFSFQPVCKLAFSANKYPSIQDTSDGLYRRLLVYELKKQFVKHGKNDLFLYDKLIKELPGIFMWALRGLQLLREEGFTPSPHMLECLAKFQQINDPVLAFVNEKTAAEPDSWISKDDLYKAYSAYCNSNGYYRKGAGTFALELLKHYPAAKEERAPSSVTPRKRGIRGVKVVDFD